MAYGHTHFHGKPEPHTSTSVMLDDIDGGVKHGWDVPRTQQRKKGEIMATKQPAASNRNLSAKVRKAQQKFEEAAQIAANLALRKSWTFWGTDASMSAHSISTR